MGGLIVLRWAAVVLFRVTGSPRAGAFCFKVNDWIDREKAAELSAQFWDLERRESAVTRNAALEERRRQRRLSS